MWTSRDDDGVIVVVDDDVVAMGGSNDDNKDLDFGGIRSRCVFELRGSGICRECVSTNYIYTHIYIYVGVSVDQ